MKKRELKRDRDRFAHYFWLRDYYGTDAAAQFFPDIHALLNRAPRSNARPVEDDHREDEQGGPNP